GARKETAILPLRGSRWADWATIDSRARDPNKEASVEAQIPSAQCAVADVGGGHVHERHIASDGCPRLAIFGHEWRPCTQQPTGLARCRSEPKIARQEGRLVRSSRGNRRRKNMTTIQKELILDAVAAHVWDALRDFHAVDKRVAPGFVTRSERDG